MIDFLENNFMMPLARLSRTKFVRAIMVTGYTVLPFTILGSMILVLNVLPQVFPSLNVFYEATIFKASDLYMTANTCTMGILSLYFSLIMGYELTKIEAQEEKLDVSPMNGALLSMLAFFMCLPELVLTDGKMKLVNVISDNETIVNGFRMGSTVQRLGTVGIFTAIIMAVISTQLYFLCVRRKWIIKMPESVPLGVSRSFSAMIPAFLVAFSVLIINGILVALGTDIFKMISIPFSFIVHTTNGFWGLMLVNFLVHALWIVGINGTGIIGPFITPIFLANMAANVDGAHIPFAGEFQSVFVYMGGCGSTLGLTIFISIFAKSKQLKILGRTALVPAIFNINEPIIFGIPVVYNPYLALPWFLAPMASATLGYLAINLQLVRPVIALTPWPLPLGIGAFLATADWKAVILSLICTVVSSLIWYPFIKIYDKKLAIEESGSMTEQSMYIEKEA
ncbi:PTS cellobiose transporter subunit IIC [Streptococcaceae bacterium ESL0687]|nr:PTS cellobiose transporter subunit IIC [Streptococcaceae bacterium ESL0687]